MRERAAEDGLEWPMPRPAYLRLARLMQDEATVYVTDLADPGPVDARVLSRTTTDLGDRWLIVEVSTAPKENRPHE